MTNEAKQARRESGVLGTALHRITMLNQEHTSVYLHHAFAYIGQAMDRLQPRGIRKTPYVRSFSEFGGVNHDLYTSTREMLVDLWVSKKENVSPLITALSNHYD